MTIDVPELETARLRLRAHRLDDFEDCLAMWTDPAVVRHIGGRPSTREEVWARILRYLGHWGALGYGYWVAEEKGTGRFVGELGFADFKRQLEPALEVPESGWALATWAHGQGFATEALQEILRWGDTRFEGGRTACIIDPGNAASIRVAGKCGYRERLRTSYKGAPTVLFER